MIPKTLLCLRWYALGCILAYFGLQAVPVADLNRSKFNNNVEGWDSSLNVKPKAPLLTGNASEALSRPAIAGEHSVLPEIKTRNDLLAALMDERVRSRLLKNSEFMRGLLTTGDWITVRNFCFGSLHWSWEDLENAVSQDLDVRSWLKEILLNDNIYANPEKAWSELLRSESQKSDRPARYDTNVLLWRAAPIMAKANPAQFLKDFPSLPENSKKVCLSEAVPALMTALEPAEAIAAIKQQLDALPQKDHKDIFVAMFNAALWHPSGEQAVQDMLNSLPEGPERKSLEDKFEKERFSGKSEDPLQ